MLRKNNLYFFDEFQVILLPAKACLSHTVGVNHHVASDWCLWLIGTCQRLAKTIQTMSKHDKCLQAFLNLYRLCMQKEVQVQTKWAAELKNSDWHLGRPKSASRGRASNGYLLEQWSSVVITSSSVSTTFISHDLVRKKAGSHWVWVLEDVLHLASTKQTA